MNRLSKILMVAALPAAILTSAAPASAGASDYLGEITRVGYTFCPRGTFEANGALLPISQWQALFSLYGTTYGGDGRTTFALPDLRGRNPIGQGNGPGLTPYQIGQRGGAETTQFTVNSMPAHNHSGRVLAENTATADTGNPKDATLARSTLNIFSDNTPPTGSTALNAGTLQVNNNGGNQAADSHSPFLAVRYCISNIGVYPSRS